MPHPTQPVAVRHPETGRFETLDPARDYAENDIMVETYGWAFVPREAHAAGEIVESVAVPVVEQATAEPGTKRTRSRARR